MRFSGSLRSGPMPFASRNWFDVGSAQMFHARALTSAAAESFAEYYARAGESHGLRYVLHLPQTRSLGFAMSWRYWLRKQPDFHDSEPEINVQKLVYVLVQAQLAEEGFK